MFRMTNGFHVPTKDIGCSAVVFSTLSDLDSAYKHCSNFNVVVQAGGNFGVWPKALSTKFKTVYTFEPDALNFACLCRNIGDIQNIIKIQAALGEGHICVDLHRREENAGAHYVEGFGIIPTFRIDDLALTECDLIVIDIEGAEPAALRGAINTIKRFKPVIHLEEKGQSERFGDATGTAQSFLESLGYSVVERKHRDIVFACK